MAPRALPSSKPKTAVEKWKAWLMTEYKDEQKFSANLVHILSLSKHLYDNKALLAGCLCNFALALSPSTVCCRL